MAGLLDQSGAFVGYPQLQRQAARMRAAAQGRIPENLPDPRTYGFVSGLLGTSPDELGMSVMSPNTQAAKEAAYYGYQLGNAAQIAPVVTPAARAFGRGLMTLGPSEAAAISNPMAQMGGVTTSLGKGIAREGNPIQSAVVLIGDKIFTGRTHGDALNRAVYEGVVRKEGGKYIFPKGAEVNSDLFMTNSGQIIDRLQASKMFDIGASETAIEKGLMQNKPSGSMSVDQYMEQAQALKKQREQPSFQYPQEQALKLAQQRAALPVEQGGLGLLAENTPEMRAQAMGFDTPVYHATEYDFSSIRPSSQGKMGAGIYTSFDPLYAERYAGGQNANTMPLITRGEMATPEIKSDVSEIVRQQMLKENPDFNLREWKARSNQMLADQGYSGLDVDKERLIFSPSNLRSRFAAFDPFRKDVATATAMGVALPDLLAAEYNQQPQSAGLLYPLP